MMSCEIIKANMPSLLAAELSEDERRRMCLHLEDCKLCRAEMAELKKTWQHMDQWEIEEPSAAVRARVMAAAREELENAHIPWWSNLQRSVIFQTVLGALGFSLILYLIFPYDRIINLCETLIFKSAFFAYFPRGLIYFALGLLYGLVPVSLAGICFSGRVAENPPIKGLSIGVIFAAFLVPFFIIQCPGFEAGLIFIMALGIIAGALSGATATLWLVSKMKMEAS